MSKSKVVIVFNLLLVVVCLFTQSYALFNTEEKLTVISTIINIIALVYSILYAVGGYSKESSFNFKAFFYLFSIAEVASITRFLVDGSSIGSNYELIKLNSPYIGVITEILCVIIPAFCLVAIVLLATNKNLGKGLSTILARIVLFSYLVCFILSFFIKEEVFTIILFGKTVLSLIINIMVYVKYKDKDLRGTI